MTDTTTLTWNPEWLSSKGNYMAQITPELAAEFLTRNEGNRRPRPFNITQFTRDMRNGRWDPDASDLKFDEDGDLLDGQNRLMACVEAGVPFTTLVRTGLKRETQTRVDTGAKRSASDALRMAGMVHYTAATASAIQARVRYTERLEIYAGKRGLDVRGTIITHEEMLDYLTKHPQLITVATPAQSMRNVLPTIQPSVHIACLSWFAEVDEKAALEFARRVAESDVAQREDPIAALAFYAARIKQRRGGQSGSAGREAQEQHMLAFVKAWNAYRAKTGIQLLSVKRSEKLVAPQ